MSEQNNNDVITLADAPDANRFKFGQRVTYGWDSYGQLYRMRWWHYLHPRRIAAAARWLLWWRRPMMRVVNVDIDKGSVTMETLRWSWRRWKWVGPS